jgi:cell division protein FtsZ
MEAARRAISSPLLEGASVNGSRGVIINVTGGPDLSLVEVSEAASIVQEAADEEANIIFGAVVDPTLKGKVKITVIATGFGASASARTPSAPAHTPVDMTAYADQPRLRAEPMAPPASLGAAQTSRLSIARRTALDLPLAAGALQGSQGSPGVQASQAGGNGHGDDMALPVRDGDADLSSPLDIPAFLRRQEG